LNDKGTHPSLTVAFDPDAALIISAYETEDDLGKILRVHLVFERQVESLVKHLSKAKIDKKTSFWSKVNLMRAIDVPESVCLACDALNDLRNEFAHNSKATIQNTKNLCEVFLEKVAAPLPVLTKMHGTFVNTKTKTEHTFEYQTAPLEQRVVIAGSALSMAMGAIPKLYTFGRKPTGVELTGVSF
jgi:hypothetical protein